MIPLYKPYMPQLPELEEILYSGQLACGKYSLKFEEVLREFLGVKNRVLVTNSFNMAIAVVNSVLDIHAGDEVIASPMACLASTQPFVAHEINIKWADIDPTTGTLDPGSVEKKISSKTKAIIHNHFCGYPGYIDEINELGRRYGIPVIDDGIEAFGSEYKRQKIGNCGTDITIFSFNAVRLPNTIDGGAIIINNAELLKKAELIRDCGIDRSIFRDDLGEINPQCDITLRGYSATMSNVNAYIGIEQMKCMEDIIRKQKICAEMWKNKLKDSKDIKIIERKEINPNYWVFGMLVANKRAVIEDYRKKGWYASGVHLNNDRYTIFGKQSALPGVSEFYSKFVALPCGWWTQDNK